MDVKRFIPILSWLPAYNKGNLKDDLIAGVTVGIMLIPQGMAYAMIAGLPPIYGLYASTMPLILYAIFGTSRQLAVGPVAMVSLLTATGIGVFAEGGTEFYIALAITLALMVGLIQFLLGILRLGFLVNFLSHPVLSGFTSAAALIIGLSQLKHLLGLHLPPSRYAHEIVWNAIEQLDAINWITFAIGIGGILLIIVTKRIKRTIPGSLITVVSGIVVVWGFDLTEKMGVNIVGSIPEGLPSLSVPLFHSETIQALLPTALVIALVSFMESIAVAKAIQVKRKNYKIEANQELIALGLANIGGSFFKSFPTTGGFSRTAVNNQSGAKTGMASILSAFLIILTLLFLTPLFYFLPKAILASIIMVAVFGLIDYKEALHLWKSNRTDFWMLMATFVATLVLGIEQGIGIGVLLSLAMVILRSTRPHIAILGKVNDSSFYRNIERFEDIKERKDLLIIRFDAELYFANVNYFQDTLEMLTEERKGLKAVIIDAESINYLDSSALHTLEEMVEAYRLQNIKLLFAGVKGPVRDAMINGQLMEQIGKDHFFMSIQEAVDYFDSNARLIDASKFQQYTLQANT